jgi:hypothetical protein
VRRSAIELVRLKLVRLIQLLLIQLLLILLLLLGTSLLLAQLLIPPLLLQVLSRPGLPRLCALWCCRAERIAGVRNRLILGRHVLIRGARIGLIRAGRTRATLSPSLACPLIGATRRWLAPGRRCNQTPHGDAGNDKDRLSHDDISCKV